MLPSVSSIACAVSGHQSVPAIETQEDEFGLTDRLSLLVGLGKQKRRRCRAFRRLPPRKRQRAS